MMTIISLKHIFKEDRIKDFFEKTEIIKEKSKYNLLKKIIDFLAPLKEEKIQLYYYLIKTVSQNDKASSTINEKIDNCSKFINQNSLDQISSKNENQSTHCSLTSNNIIIDVEEHNMNDFKHLQPGYNSQGIYYIYMNFMLVDKLQKLYIINFLYKYLVKHRQELIRYLPKSLIYISSLIIAISY